MARFFNTAGPCQADDHYMLPPERRLAGIRQLIDRKQYFAVHAPRQVGKTTSIRALARSLTAEGRYAALHTSCEMGQAAGGDVEAGVAALLDGLRQNAELQLPANLRPPPADGRLPAATRLRDLLSRWARECERPVVIFFDEIDALLDGTLISVLRQLRDGYIDRPAAFAQSVALVGLRDVRDYRIEVRPEPISLGTASPFNIKVESLTLRNFTAQEVAELYEQHTAETGQVFTAEATQLAFELTRGHPWLVNALAREAVERQMPDPSRPITAEVLAAAKEALVQRRDTHLDSLLDRLRDPRVRRVLEPILAGEFLPPDLYDDDVQLVEDLGLLVAGPQGLEIANPIYQEIIPRGLTGVIEKSLPVAPASYVGPDGILLFGRLLEDFRAFWCEHAEFFLARQPYSEAAAQLILMAYLQRIVNGGGFIDREYGAGRGRIDLCIRWPHPRGLERWALELKVWRDGRPDPLERGLDQLSDYLDRLGLERGALVLFDGRSEAAPIPQRCSSQRIRHRGRDLDVVRL